jgi:hypothetical protein
MTDTLSEVIVLLEAFVSGQMAADAFVVGYGELWNRIRQQQDDAVSSTPGAEATLREARADLVAGSISTDVYGEIVKTAYAALPRIPVVPGSPADELLSHLFVEAGAYEGDSSSREAYQIDEAALREEAGRVLTALRAERPRQAP